MNDHPNKLLEEITVISVKVCELAKTAKRNNKSIRGDNFYGNSFHSLAVELAALEKKILPLFSSNNLGADDSREFQKQLAILKSDVTGSGLKTDALKKLQFLIATTLKPALEVPPDYPTPAGEHVLPFAVVKGTRGFIEAVVNQANSTYETRCFDACAVMIRKLVEILLIEAHEAKGKEKAIKNSAGDYFMLSDIINATLGDVTWGLGRETKQALPKLKSLGDRSAHNRRYIATKPDVDAVISGLRVTVDDLLHLAGLK